LRAGYTPYVNDLGEQEAFFEWWRRVFEYLATRKIPPVRLSHIEEAIKASR